MVLNPNFALGAYFPALGVVLTHAARQAARRCCGGCESRAKCATGAFERHFTSITDVALLAVFTPPAPTSCAAPALAQLYPAAPRDIGVSGARGEAMMRV